MPANPGIDSKINMSFGLFDCAESYRNQIYGILSGSLKLLQLFVASVENLVRKCMSFLSVVVSILCILFCKHFYLSSCLFRRQSFISHQL